MRRVSTDLATVLVLSIIGGAFISFGAIFATTVSAGTGGLPYGVAKLLTGIAFTVGFVTVIVAGAELFTGNNLIVMAWASGKVKTRGLLLNWLVTFAGNCAGALATAGLMFYTTQYTFGAGAVGLGGIDNGQQQGGARIRSRVDAWHHVQRARVSCVMDVLQRAYDR